MPKEVLEVMSTIIHNGYEVYIVGGYVRDYLLGIPNEDYDLTTNIPLEKLKNLLPSLHIMKENNHRNTSTITVNNKIIEISTFKGKSVQEDLNNRDYTINAMALDINNKLIDPHNYQEDLKSKTIKLVKDDGTGIDYDPLRILRALRLSLSHDLNINSHTKDILIKKKDLLNTIAPERIYSELIKILNYDKASNIIRDYKEIFFIIIPELEKTYKFEQHNNYHIYDVFEHTLKVLDNVDNNNYLKLAALFHDLGKPEKFFTDEQGIGHFYGHWHASNNIFKKFCKAYKVDKKTEKIVSLLIINHDRTLATKRSSMLKLLQEYNPKYLDLLFNLKRADILAQNPIYHEELLAKLEQDQNRFKQLLSENPVITTNDLAISGHDLMGLGYEGKEIKKTKEKVLTLVMSNKIDNTKETIMNYLRKKGGK